MTPMFATIICNLMVKLISVFSTGKITFFFGNYFFASNEKHCFFELRFEYSVNELPVEFTLIFIGTKVNADW